MYGAGLERIVGALLAAGEDGRADRGRAADDPLVATLLLIHDLHPVPLEERVQAALDSVRPYMESHGGNVELLSLEDGVARIRLRGSCSDCSASSVTLELAIKQALEEAAPDLDGLEVEGVAPQTIDGLGAADGHRLRADRDGAAGDRRRRRRRRRRGSRSSARRARATARSSPVDGRRQRARDRERRGHAARLPRRVRGLRRPLHDGELRGGRARLPAAARARSSCRARGARWTTSGSSSSRCRCCASRAAVKVALAPMSANGNGRPAGATARRRGRGPPARRAGVRAARRSRAGRARAPRAGARPATAAGDARSAICAAIAIPDDHRHLLHLVERRIVCACEAAGRCAPARATTARPATGRCGCRSWTFPTICGRASRSRSGWRSSWSRRSPRASSRCTRARPARPSRELHFESWSRMRELNPVLRGLEPDIEGLIVNRLVEPAACT